MYDIKPLEKEWNKYKKKQRRPYYILIGFVLILSVIIFILKFKGISLSNLNKSDTDENITKSSLSINHKTKDINVTTKPSNNPMNPDDVFVDEKVLNSSISGNIKKSKVKIDFEINDANDPKIYKEIEKRFTQSPNSDDSMFLSRMYYNKKNYHKSAYWSLETNKINGNIEESWLIFAKSKAKIGQKNEAIRVLSKYINKSDSLEAKRLLKTLKNN